MPAYRTNHAEAEAGVAAAYLAAGLPEPEKIVWCQSPVGIEKDRKANWHQSDPGQLVIFEVVTKTINEAWKRALQQTNAGRATTPEHETGEVHVSPPYSIPPNLAEALDRDAQALRWTFQSRISRLYRNATPPQIFRKSRWLPQASPGEHDNSPFPRNYNRSSEMGILRGLLQLSRNVSAMVPHARICWLSEHPETLATDETGRLHCATGPAVRFRDGWDRYAWKGTVIPAWMIESDTLSAAHRIDRERDPIQRRCLIEIMTPAKYIASGWVPRRAIDKNGSLWHKRWADGDSWSAVEVVNGTAETDGTFRHYFLQVPPDLRTPTAAVAWSYGMTMEQYKGLFRRT